jgi:hypothetical protein
VATPGGIGGPIVAEEEGRPLCIYRGDVHVTEKTGRLGRRFTIRVE